MNFLPLKGLFLPVQCQWGPKLNFLTGRPQAVRVGSNTSSTITLNTGAPQGCVLSPLLFTLLTHDCTPSHNSNRFIKFADDMTVVDLISNRDETNYRSEVSRLDGWCSDNNLSLNVEKTKEIVVDFRRVHSLHAPLTINGATVERVSSTKFLGVHITEDLSWTNNTAALAKKAQQRLYFLRKLRRARAPAPIMCTFYRGTIESILTSCITVWYGACNASCRKSLQRIVRAAEKIIGVSLPSLQDIYNTHLTRKALSIAGDPTHSTHNFFSLLPSGRRLRSLQARTNRQKDSFIHQAVRKLNSLPSLPPLPSLTPRNTELWIDRIDNKADFDFWLLTLNYNDFQSMAKKHWDNFQVNGNRIFRVNYCMNRCECLSFLTMQLEQKEIFKILVLTLCLSSSNTASCTLQANRAVGRSLKSIISSESSSVSPNAISSSSSSSGSLLWPSEILLHNVPPSRIIPLTHQKTTLEQMSQSSWNVKRIKDICTLKTN